MAKNASGHERSARTEAEDSGFAERMLSYAQNFEDVLLRRVYPNKTDGFYIDVGAHHPLYDSVTRYFYELGWHGINVEPIPDLCKLLREERVRDISLNIGLSNNTGSAIFYESLSQPALSTFDPANAKNHIELGEEFRERTVSLSTLAKVCEEHAVAEIDFLSIDVEGLERQVLEGADFERWRPRVVLVESTHPNSRRPAHHLWEDVLLDADYTFAFFDGLNRFYVRSEDAALCECLAVPANVFDNFVPYRYYVWSLSSRETRPARRRLSQLWRALRGMASSGCVLP